LNCRNFGMMLLSLQRFRNARFDSFLARKDLSLLNVYFSKDTLPVEIFDNILEASISAFYIDYAFHGFPPYPNS